MLYHLLMIAETSKIYRLVCLNIAEVLILIAVFLHIMES